MPRLIRNTIIYKLIISYLTWKDTIKNRSSPFYIPVLWLGFATLLCFISCKQKVLPNQAMIDLLQFSQESYNSPENAFSPESMIKFCDSVLKNSSDQPDLFRALTNKGNALLKIGEEEKAIENFRKALDNNHLSNIETRQAVMKDLAITYLRWGERINCIHNHNAESCIFPISQAGIHSDKTASQKAIEIYKSLLMENPGDLESRWLLNIAYMTTGGYPQSVPPQFLLQINNEDSLQTVKPFADLAANLGLNYKCQAGGNIVEDFNNDGYPDIVLSSWSLQEPMHFFLNNANGTFTDITRGSGLEYLTGGLHMMQTDYNNDGYKDIFVLRGGWKREFGNTPNSLLKNNRDGTFTDVTKESGLLSFHPTQTATWADFNNDGWIDVFIGNETIPGGQPHPCELYINNKNGTFSEIAKKAGCALNEFVKGVTSGDYNNDGLPDFFLSTLNGNKILLRNESDKNGVVKFTDVSREAGLSNNKARTFPTWFWDYDNDGWLDILVCGYEFTESLAWYAGAEAIDAPLNNAGKVFLFRNKRDGTFEEVSREVGLNKIAFAMGSNFGDIDNDGYLDFYLGTGNPSFKSAVPNKLFKNNNGTNFTDVTLSARVGNLQKGHAVSFVDLDNDGNQDIYIKMGGAYKGDSYENSLYVNPGQNNNHWINLSLEGMVSNKAAIGAKIKVTFRDNERQRFVYREVNSGGSFGSNPLRQHIGVGQATSIERVEITWPVTGQVQVFENLPVDTNFSMKEGDTKLNTYDLQHFNFTKSEKKAHLQHY